MKSLNVHLKASQENNSKMTLQLLEKDRARIRNLLEREIKEGYKLVTDNFISDDLKNLLAELVPISQASIS